MVKKEIEKKNLEEQRDVYVIGRPSFENLDHNTKQAFCHALLQRMIEQINSEKRGGCKKTALDNARKT